MPQIAVPDQFENRSATYAYGTFSPELSKAAMEFSTSVYKNVRLPLREFEAARARVAQINGCQTCQAFRSGRDVPAYIEGNGGDATGSIADRGDKEPDEEFYENVADWQTSPIYSERERLAIDLAERFSLAPTSVDGDVDFWDRIHAAFSDEELFELMLAIGSWVAFGRVMHMLEFDGGSACGI
ncbi:MAG TPA: carboxymuconolactone decarboxylase family protein [Solirubrobacterales bacterium]|nr:carboxymuconolactone decarboxylase family protein [Solirubrobacterales bacterium]